MVKQSLEPQNATPCALLMICWLLSPLAVRLNRPFPKGKGSTTTRSRLGGILNLICIILSMTAVAIAVLPIRSIKILMWVFVLWYDAGIAIAPFDHKHFLLKPLSASGMTIGFTVVPFLGLWMYSNLIAVPSLWTEGFGHLIPGVLNFLVSIQALSARDFLDLQRRESTFLLVGGMASFVINVFGTRGSVIGNLIYQNNWNLSRNVQHSVDLVLVIAGGAIGRMCCKYNWVTSLHLLIPSITNLVIMYQHTQPTEMAMVMHVSFGVSTLFAVYIRSEGYVIEAMVLGFVSSFNFTMSGNHICAWANLWSFPYGFLFLYYAIALIYIAYVMYLFVEPQKVTHWRPGHRRYLQFESVSRPRIDSITEHEFGVPDDELENTPLSKGKANYLHVLA